MLKTHPLVSFAYVTCWSRLLHVVYYQVYASIHIFLVPCVSFAFRSRLQIVLAIVLPMLVLGRVQSRHSVVGVCAMVTIWKRIYVSGSTARGVQTFELDKRLVREEVERRLDNWLWSPCTLVWRSSVLYDSIPARRCQTQRVCLWQWSPHWVCYVELHDNVWRPASRAFVSCSVLPLPLQLHHLWTTKSVYV